MFTTLRHAVLTTALLVSVAICPRPVQAAATQFPQAQTAGTLSPQPVSDWLRLSTSQPAPDAKPPQPVTPPPTPPAPGGKPVTPPSPPPADTDKLINVKFVTTAGDIFVELNNEKAPISVKNFLSYVDKKAYDDNIFHRVMPDFVIQGGGFKADLKEIKGDAPIKNEWQNGLKNLRGTIAMARMPEPDSATRQFYFNTKDNAMLDGQSGRAGYAVFGKVVAGMAVVDKIRLGKTHEVGSGPGKMSDVPVEPVTITSVVRITEADAKKATDAETTTPPAPAPAPPPLQPPNPPAKTPRKPPPREEVSRIPSD